MIHLPISPDAPLCILHEVLMPKLNKAQQLLADGEHAETAKALRTLEAQMGLLSTIMAKLSGRSP